MDVYNTKVFSDRRRKARTSCNYTALVEGEDLVGQSYAENARVVNLSASGLYMWTFRPIMVKTDLSVTIAIPSDIHDVDASRLETNGTVVRCETHPNGAYGIAIKFQKYRFL